MSKDDIKIQLAFAENNPWYKFMKKSIELDGKKHPLGYHWFWEIYFLHNKIAGFPKINFNKIQKILPKEHWLKKIDIADAPSESNLEVQILLKELSDMDNPINTNHIDFSKLHFRKTIDFSNFIFPVDVSFEHTMFSGNVSFENAIFKGYINFKDSKIQRRASFQKAKFEIHAPRFYGAELNKEVTWDNITWPTFPNVRWALWQDILRFIESDSADMEYVKNVRENQNSYEDLANHMEDLNKYHDQHLFFRREMGCRRRLENYFIRLFYWLYEKLANYGYGIGQAFTAWLGHIFIGFVFIALIAYCGGLEIWEILFCSLSVSTANANPFVFFGFKEGALMDCYECLHDLSPLGFGTIRGVQTIFGIPILFLLLTTLRVRFRLK